MVKIDWDDPAAFHSVPPLDNHQPSSEFYSDIILLSIEAIFAVL